VTRAVRTSWLADYVAESTYGPLPALLLTLTIATGLVDAVSILSLGRVFVANMTGNVVFIGFALAGAPGFSLAASLVALVAFLIGAGAGGVVVARFAQHRGRLLLATTVSETILLAAGAVALATAPQPYTTTIRDLVVAALALAMGLQNAAARKLAVPDFTTTVLTMTLTGIAADLRARRPRVAARRISAVAAMLLGAVVGAECVLHGEAAAALFTSCALVAGTAVALALSVRRDSPWHRPA
jgi:uncharacterized membrane protein YoaK (UPF0700 family)